MKEGEPGIIVDIGRQKLFLHEEDGSTRQYPVSTAANGPGQVMGSECTPLGEHVIRARIGEGQPENAVFVARRPTAEIYSVEFGNKFPGRDWMLTRIMWLSGLESGFNRLGNVDTMQRFIYIHGCPDEDELGKPGSHGCIKMRNTDVIDLFDRVAVGTPVDIVENTES